MSKKNCLNCAFLVCHQETYRSVFHRPELSKWVNNIKSLDIESRNSIKDDDLSFLGESLRKREEWQVEYERKKQEKQSASIFASPVISDLLGHGPTNEELKELGLAEPPDACDHDYLECYHEQWTENRKRTSPTSKNFLSEKSCCFYFPQKNIEQKSLEACEKTRMHEKNQKRFLITNILVILGILITVLLYTPTQAFVKNQWKTVTIFIAELKKQDNLKESK